MPASLACQSLAPKEPTAVLPAAPALAPVPVRVSADASPRLRSAVFNVVFLAYTFLFVLSVYPLLLWPSRRPLARAMKAYARGVVWLMRRIAGIRVAIQGREHLPRGSYILAGKHQSEADGLIQMALIDDIAFVAMKEVGK